MGQQEQSENAVLLEISDGYAVITLNRPRAYNAMNHDLADGLLHSLIACDENPGSL